jgi:hypothetical protein
MAIQEYFEGQVFDQETISGMSDALSAACRAIGLNPQQDAATKLLAMRIIDRASEGVHDTSLLKAAALEGLVTASHWRAGC